MHLTPDLIVDSAWSIVDTYGLSDLSMRRLATTLGVQPSALYWHVPSKQALLGLLADRLLHPVPSLPSPDTTAPIDPVGFGLLLFDAVTALPDGAEITMAALSTGTARRTINAEARAAWGAAGSVTIHYVLGAAMAAATQAQLQRHGEGESVGDAAGVYSEVRTEVAEGLRIVVRGLVRIGA